MILVAKALDVNEQNLLARQFVFETQTKIDFLLSEITRVAHSDDLKAIRRLLKEIFFFASEITNSNFINSDIKNYSNNMKKWINEALSSPITIILSHDLISQINGQLFLMKKELAKIDTKTRLSFQR